MSRFAATLLLTTFLALGSILTVASNADDTPPPAEPPATTDDGDPLALEHALTRARVWRGRAHQLQRQLVRQGKNFRRAMRTNPRGYHWLEVAFACIHRYEAPWKYDGPIYDGGLQFDRQFQRTYGADYLRAWGPAYKWPRAVQITVAINAYLHGRGFRPWPRTARACGLL